MPAESSRAVFLSYASQDAEAARRICEALRAEGVEVWFDQSELVGGDVWDAKIRGQIATCALFVPIISANTQERREGYFRIEWRLAAQRTHAMSDDTAFLLPVVIDETRDADARVPAEFKAVQWTRLPGGEASEKFCARVKTLLGGSDVARAFQPVSPSDTGWKARATPKTSRRVPAPVWIAAATVVAASALYFALRPTQNTDAKPALSSNSSTATPPPATAKAAAPLSPARQLVEKARVLYEPWDLATKDDLVMADQFLKRAIELDPTDGEVWAHQALVSCAFVAMSATLEDRRVEMRLQAERAVKLAPNSDNARFARAFAIRLEGKPGAWEEAVPILRDVVARNPENRLMLRGLAHPLAARAETRDEGLAVYRRATALPGGDAVAEFNIGQTQMGGSRNLKEALAAFDRSLKLAPLAHRTHSYKIDLLLRLAGDLPAARQALREVPEAALREDPVITIATRVLLATGETDEALRLLGSTYPYLSANSFNGPTPYLKGLAHQQANRPSAAATEWNVALKEIQRRLDAIPTARIELRMKAATLAHLGRHAEAAEALELYQQLVPANAQNEQRVLIVKTLLGRIPEVVAALDKNLTSRSRNTAASFILFDPELTALRAHPSYAALAEKARAVYVDVQLK
ncbi:MAG: TIR domain-containing protein [Verrucomicrobia bacterium]|nr:TIR domain-containing protein [Verrucomicrobiota bacterium]